MARPFPPSDIVRIPTRRMVASGSPAVKYAFGLSEAGRQRSMRRKTNTIFPRVKITKKP